jgi:hypothetical protein
VLPPAQKHFKQEAEPTAMSQDILSKFEWYDGRLKRVMTAYALTADDVLGMYDVYHPLDFKNKGSIDVMAFYDLLVGQTQIQSARPG